MTSYIPQLTYQPIEPRHTPHNTPAHCGSIFVYLFSHTSDELKPRQVPTCQVCHLWQECMQKKQSYILKHKLSLKNNEGGELLIHSHHHLQQVVGPGTSFSTQKPCNITVCNSCLAKCFNSKHIGPKRKRCPIRFLQPHFKFKITASNKD